MMATIDPSQIVHPTKGRKSPQHVEADESKKELSSLRRGIRALKALNASDSVSASSLAKELDVPRTTARRILDTLVAEGLAEKVPHDFIYRLSPHVECLSSGLSEEVIITHVASPLLYEHTKKIGWALAMGTISDADMVIQIATHRTSPFALTRPRVGTRCPIFVSPAAWMTIAFLPEDEQEAMIDRLHAEPRFTPWMQLVREPMSEIRQKGFSITTLDAIRQSVVCLPVFVNKKIKACLMMTYTTSAMSIQAVEAEFVPTLKSLTLKIEQGVHEIQVRKSHRAPNFTL
jgi:IclR family mhp operon transcriptional activator